MTDQTSGAVEAVELKPCPFCGGDASQEWSRDATGEFSYITCTECSGQADHPQTWNTRATPSDQGKLISELREALAECARVLKDRIPRIGPEGPNTAAEQLEYEEVGGAWSMADRLLTRAERVNP